MNISVNFMKDVELVKYGYNNITFTLNIATCMPQSQTTDQPIVQ